MGSSSLLLLSVRCESHRPSCSCPWFLLFLLFFLFPLLAQIGNGLDSVDRDQLGWWLSERQCDSGGLNGRPEKQADVCYSWWVLSVMAILDRLDWIDSDKLITFILQCQNEEDGGIADRPGDEADVFHTFFGICGLSFLGYLDTAGVKHVDVNPTFAMPVDVVERLGLKCQTYFDVNKTRKGKGKAVEKETVEVEVEGKMDGGSGGDGGRTKE